MSNEELTINMNFFGDYVEILRNRLIADGFLVDPPTSHREQHRICNEYFYHKIRKVAAIPRTVLQSNEFTCPAPHQAGLDLVIEKIQNGTDLTPHLHRPIETLGHPDPLLTDWGIHHLHLGTRPYPRDPRFVDRTGLVLFVRFDNENAYLLTVMEHGRGHKPWIKQELVRIIHRNWPNIIQEYKININLGTTYTEEEHGQLRNAGIVDCITMDDGMVYTPIGGGFASNGTSIEVVKICDFFANGLRKGENEIRTQINAIVEHHRVRGRTVGSDLEFQLEVVHDVFINGEMIFRAVEQRSELQVLLRIRKSNDGFRIILDFPEKIEPS